LVFEKGGDNVGGERSGMEREWWSGVVGWEKT